MSIFATLLLIKRCPLLYPAGPLPPPPTHTPRVLLFPEADITCEPHDHPPKKFFPLMTLFKWLLFSSDKL